MRRCAGKKVHNGWYVVEIRRHELTIRPDPSRVVARPFVPGQANFGGATSRLDAITSRVLGLRDDERERRLAEAHQLAAGRYRDIESVWRRHVHIAADQSPLVAGVEDPETGLLLGAFFTQSYAYESAALTNPSMVPVGSRHPDGAQSFVLSARAIGEGHISSIAFLSGRVGTDGEITLDERSPFADNGARHTPHYDRQAFAARLAELEADNEISRRVLDQLDMAFTAPELQLALDRVQETDIDLTMARETLHRIHWLASSNYVLEFAGTDITERLISPAGPAESRGMEDARFVRFVGEDGDVRYYATYTAFDGEKILPQLIETADFARFRISTLSGAMARHKGIALFPRRIDGLFVALSRHDQESTFVMRSDRLREWRNAELAFGPEMGWEVVQGGNCGSPLETDDGWLVITHGVGPMRRYALGAVLLDLDEPTKVVARLPAPLLEPEGEERIGYVPNVLYSCGSMICDGTLVVPYGFADRGIKFATAPVADVLAAMV